MKSEDEAKRVQAAGISPAQGLWRPAALLIVSCFLYAAASSVAGLVLLVCLIVSTYLLGRLIAQTEGVPRRLALWCGVGLNLGAIAVVKYTPALSGETAGNLKAVPAVAAVVGLSYYSLQAVGYLVDVNHNRSRSQGNGLYFGLSFLFFPKVLQGPIERIGSFVSKLKSPARVNYQVLRSGLVLAGLGVGKKVIIADTIGRHVTGVLSTPAANSGLPLVVAVYAFALQIFFDFSGYTDIAVGVGRCFGVELTQNFDRPYWSSSIAEFWRRWHISLSSWLRDFVFLPLAYRVSSLSEKLGLSNRLSDHASYAAAASATMLACGLWHGATPCFLVWGAFHGIALVVGRVSQPFRRRFWRAVGLEGTQLKRYFSVAFTFHTVAFSWIVFRAANLSEAWSVVANLAGPPRLRGAFSGTVREDLLGVFLLTAVVLLLERRFGSPGLAETLTRQKWPVRWAVYVAVALGVLVAGGTGQPSQFMYARF